MNTIIKFGNCKPVKFRLVSHSWNEMIFLTLDPVQKQNTTEILQAVGCNILCSY